MAMLRKRVLGCNLSVLSFLCAVGCTLPEAEERGAVCPPPGDAGELSYIQMGSGSVCYNGDKCFEESFRYRACPQAIPMCGMNTEGAYYCMSQCDAPQVACNGQCIDPQTSTAYCGAVDECDGVGCCSGYEKCADGVESCVNGHCKAMSCDKSRDSVVCRDGKIFYCNGNVWHESMKCGRGVCRDGIRCEGGMTQCAQDGNVVGHGALACGKDRKTIVKCQDGQFETQETCGGELVCGETLDGISCVEPDYAGCLWEDRLIAHGASICEGELLRTCQNGEFGEGVQCADGERTYCLDGQCVDPSCRLGDKSVANGGQICDGNVLYTCRGSQLADGADCASRTDGRIICRENACDFARACTVAGLEHGQSACSPGGRVLSCNDGVAREVQDCEADELVCAGARCVPRFTSVKEIRRQFDKLFPKSSCQGKDNEFIAADVVLEGVVTAVRGKIGFVLQEVSKTPEYSGITVFCEKGECQKYADGSDVLEGDNVRVRANGLSGYYCQLQVRSEDGGLSVEKIERSEKIDPVLVSGDQIDVADTVYEPNNPYNNVLVRVDTVTAGVYQEKNTQESGPKGWRTIDQDGKSVVVSDALHLVGKSGMSQHASYRVSGIVFWAFNASVLSPRRADDIVEIPDCKSGQTANICLRREGNELATICKNGEPENVVNCSEKGMVCGLENVTRCDASEDCDMAYGESCYEKLYCKCTPGTKKCGSDFSDIYVCDADGMWQKTESCGSGKVCDAASAACLAFADASCAAGQTRCVTKSSSMSSGIIALQIGIDTCSDEGKWAGTFTQCPSIACSGGKCGDGLVYPVDAESAVCRRGVICKDAHGNGIVEGKNGCINENELAQCSYVSCYGTDGACENSAWKNTKTCAYGCDPVGRRCKDPEIAKCEFGGIDEEKGQAAARVGKLSDAAVSVQTRCTTELSLPVADWPYAIEMQQTACEGCADGLNAYQTAAGALPMRSGQYACAVVATIEGGAGYICPTTLGKPNKLGDQTAAVNEMRRYEIGNVAKVLASFEFEDNLDPDVTVIPASISLQKSTKDVEYYSGIGGTKSAGSDGWSIFSDPSISDKHWEVTLDASGFSSLSLQFSTKSSKDGYDIRVAVKKDGAFGTVIEDIHVPDNEWHDHKAPLLEIGGPLTFGIFPYGLGKASTTLRLESLKISGIVSE